MIIFRPHRMGMDIGEAMEKAKEFNTVDEMKEYIVELWQRDSGSPKLFTIDDIVIDEKSAVNDTRIGWKDSMYVCVKRMGDENFIAPLCIGMCATKYR